MSTMNLAWVAKTMTECTKVLKAVVAGMDEDPGHSDLDNEQPIHVSMTLGDYRRAQSLLYELERKP